MADLKSRGVTRSEGTGKEGTAFVSFASEGRGAGRFVVGLVKYVESACAI
jgi:hypothetical protein